jgi:hypothetical protein
MDAGMDLHLTKEAGRLGTVPRGMRLCSTATARGARLNGIRLRRCDLVKAKRWLPRSVALLLELSIPPTLHTTHPATAEHHRGAPLRSTCGGSARSSWQASLRYSMWPLRYVKVYSSCICKQDEHP